MESISHSKTSLLVGVATILAGILIPIHIALCANVWWYGERVVPPEISVNFEDEFSSKTAIEPLLGEGMVQDEEGNYSITIIDHRIHSKDTDKTPDIEINIIPANATIKKAKTTFKITQLGMQIPDNSERWYYPGHSDFQDKVLADLNDKYTFTIKGSNVRYNEGVNSQPVKYRIVAKNKRGEATVMLTISRYPLYYACEQYEVNHPGRSAVADVPLCKKRADYNEAHKTTNDSSNSSSTNSNSNNSTNNSNTSKPASSGSICTHYEAGRCWDDLEEEAYSQGQWDKIYGHYGDSYYESGDCDSICQNILEDAYDEGYDNY